MKLICYFLGVQFIFLNCLAQSQMTYKNFTILPTVKAQQSTSYRSTLDLVKKKIDQSLALSSKFTLLSTTTKIWLTDSNWSRSAVVTHVSKEWLQQNGMDIRMYNGIEILNLKNFADWTEKYQPLMLLHEFTHAYLFNKLGWSNSEIAASYNSAMNQRLYDSVPYLRLDGAKLPAYAKNNAQEYFSAMTEAYFGANDYFPFNRDQLKSHDPRAYNLLRQIWGTGSVLVRLN